MQTANCACKGEFELSTGGWITEGEYRGGGREKGGGGGIPGLLLLRPLVGRTGGLIPLCEKLGAFYVCRSTKGTIDNNARNWVEKQFMVRKKKKEKDRPS